MKKEQLDLANRVVFVEDSKTPELQMKREALKQLKRDAGAADSGRRSDTEEDE